MSKSASSKIMNLKRSKSNGGDNRLRLDSNKKLGQTRTILGSHSRHEHGSRAKTVKVDENFTYTSLSATLSQVGKLNGPMGFEGDEGG